MTCIIHGVLTKRQLKDWAQARNAQRSLSQHPQLGLTGWPLAQIRIEDPSILKPRDFRLEDMPLGSVEFVTNHPKRSWYARIERTFDGIFKVS